MIRGDVMINIEKTDNIEQEYLQCSSCLKCNDDLDMFRLTIGKNMRQTITIKLCEECMHDLFDDLNSLVRYKWNENFVLSDKEDLMENNKMNIRERLIQALDDFGVGNEMYDETNESLADYLIEVIDELRK